MNHLSESDLEKHFAEDGKNEDRIYSTLPLVIKGWLKEELSSIEGEGGESSIRILEDYLEAENRAIAAM